MKYIVVLFLAISCVRNEGHEEREILTRYLEELSYEYSEGKELLIIIPETYCGGCVSHFLFELDNQLANNERVTMITCGNVNLPVDVKHKTTQIVDSRREMMKYDLGLENINIYEIEDSEIMHISHFTSSDIETLDEYIVKAFHWLGQL